MAAIADKIMNETLPKSKLEEFYDAYNDLLYKRKKAFLAIQRMPSGEAKNRMIQEFQSAESITANYVFPAVNKVFSLIGYREPDSKLPNNGTFGFIPAMWGAFVAASYATQAIVAATVVGTLGILATTTARYVAITINPEVAKYDEGFFSSITSGANKAVVIVAVAAGAAALLLAYRRK